MRWRQRASDEMRAERNRRDGGEKLATAVESKGQDGGGEQRYCAAHRGKSAMKMCVSLASHDRPETQSTITQLVCYRPSLRVAVPRPGWG